MLKVAENLVLAMPYAKLFLKLLEKRHLHEIVHTQTT